MSHKAMRKKMTKWRQGVWRRPRPTVSKKASKALRLVKKLNDAIEVKEKTATATAATTAVDDTWSNIPLVFGIAQGDTAEQREGNKIEVKSMAFRIKMVLDAAETSNSATRVVIFIDKRPKHTQVTEGEVFSTTDILGFYETQALENKGRFKFIYDKTFHWGGNPAVNSRPLYKIKKFFYNVPFQQLYTGSGATIAAIDRNAVYICAVSSNASHTGTVTAQYKVKYSDM